MPNLEQAAKQFHEWMQNYEDSHRNHGHFTDNNKALVSFLDADRGFKYVKTYEELSQLATILSGQYEYTIKTPPCSPADFVKAIDSANPQSFEGKAPTIPPEGKLIFSADKFDRWMKNYDHSAYGHSENNNKALIDYLGQDQGHKYVETYNEFCRLANILKDRGYTTTNPPCTQAEFMQAHAKAIKTSQHDEGQDEKFEPPSI